ncbi:MAG: conjugal transfer protein TraX [Clostridiales Family XIII bacterium]|jgi:hypothetical protein|nr:conjugal transfer protein TraX [Clostridiales Family XIII bacterium]
MNNEIRTNTEKTGPAALSGLRCLTGSQLKFLGVILMVFDHLHQMFFMFGVPTWFTWIGRLVAPIFLFMCAEGFHYTRNKGRYMLQLFIGFEFMSIVSPLLSGALPNADIVLMNNIFGTMFLCAFYMWLTDMLKGGIKAKKPAKIALAVALAVLSVLAGFALISLLGMPAFLENPHSRQLFALVLMIPNVFLAEGGFPLVILGLLFYIFREKRPVQMAILVAFGLMTLFLTDGAQWMMLFAAIPLLMYNGERGKGNKYFFYIFYPAHIYIFYIISCLMR